MEKYKMMSTRRKQCIELHVCVRFFCNILYMNILDIHYLRKAIFFPFIYDAFFYGWKKAAKPLFMFVYANMSMETNMELYTGGCKHGSLRRWLGCEWSGQGRKRETGNKNKGKKSINKFHKLVNELCFCYSTWSRVVGCTCPASGSAPLSKGQKGL